MNHSSFQIRGVVEGFYGVFYTFPERNDMIRFIGRHGFNFYVYGPKNDRQHRARWWEPYPDQIMEQFAQTVAIAQEVGVTFCYSISPISYASSKDFELLTPKLQSFFDRGVRAFAILFDDIVCTEQYEANRKIYEEYASTHIAVSNRLYSWLQSLDPACTLAVCPAEYYGRFPFSDYLHELGAGLDLQINLFYTGPEICSQEILISDVNGFAHAARRAPLIWDNYPVNDLDMKAEMHIGPIRGRDDRLHQVVKGFVVNTMVQAEASKIPLLTFAAYFDDPHNYDPWRSWERALREIGTETGYEALSLFAENSLHSCLGTGEAFKLEYLTGEALHALKRGESASRSTAVRSLELYINNLDEACYFLKNRMTNLPLRTNLLPWIEALEDWLWLSRRAILILQLMESGGEYEEALRFMGRSIDEIRRHSKRIGGTILLSLAQYVAEQAGQKRSGTIGIPGEQSDRSLEPGFWNQVQEKRSMDAA